MEARSSRQSRMAIDSLLNPSADRHSDPIGYSRFPYAASPSPTRASTEPVSMAATTSSSATDRRRPPPPKYEEEEMYFIWYHRVDLCQEWKEVRECFNRQFPNRQRCGFQGIQCKFYRFIRDKKCPTLREQRLMRDGKFLRQGSTLETNYNDNHTVVSEIGPPKFGVIEWMGVWYPWMRENPDQVNMMVRRIST